MKKIIIILINVLSILISGCSSMSGAVGHYLGPMSNQITTEVFYATDRKENINSGIKFRFGEKRGELKYGITKVSIPIDHRMGGLERPSLWKFELKENPEKHVVLLDIKRLTTLDFYETITNKISDSKQKNAFIFVHGYNTTFEEAARRTAQMSYDLAFDGVPVFYSWPSHGNATKYTFDEANIKWSQANLEKFLKHFADKSDAQNIFLIAHSMGNRALTRAYISLINNNPEFKSRFKEIILTAPDIDSEVFKRDIAPKMIEIGNPITLYASSEDVPLKISKAIHGGYPRAGDSGEDIVILPGIESIDSANVKTDFLGHSYYAEGKSVISDIFYILNEGLRANNRAGLNKVRNMNGYYWKFKK